ncbi:DUF5348 domain-containing protein [Sedimentibacter sp. MB31-C6]|uniref:DUF5348 domain-containing protein n=1 Tax=Sedimentibacter sp. MB31-C6 TaxID=3109366 RepID=UPI002DDD870A|nr:DUF5348 domain-containing protein [Sedimentibacter sp. MB36-C1]WSI05092.1 DUF5348 domain-containing protein [Sedimentibacter sp. MB36-C1]
MSKKAFIEIDEVINQADELKNKCLLMIDNVEEDRVNNALDSFVAKIEDFIEDLYYLNAPVKEGILSFDSTTEKFYISYNDGTDSFLFGCGTSIEIYDINNDEWIIGRIEGRNIGTNSFVNEYYFYGVNNPTLYKGMRVRKRQM